MSIRFNISYIIVVFSLYLCLQCDRENIAENIKECMKSQLADICIKIYKGL